MVFFFQFDFQIFLKVLSPKKNDVYQLQNKIKTKIPNVN